MNPDCEKNNIPQHPFRRKSKAIMVRDIENRILVLRNMIRLEKNSKEKARLVDEQAAFILTLRVLPAITVETVI